MTRIRLPVLLCGLLASGWGEVHVQTVEGHIRVGKILGLEDGRLVLRAGSERHAIPLQEILALESRAVPSIPPRGTAWVELTDGDRLAADVLGGARDRLRVRVLGREEASIPLSALRRIVFSNRSRGRRPEEFAAPPRGDRLYRPTESEFDRLDGTLLAVEESAFQFESRLGRTTVSFEEVAALVLEPLDQGPEARRLLAVFDLADGSRLTGALLRFENDRFLVETRVQPTLAIPLGEVRAMRLRGGLAVSLSDLEPTSVEETPFFGGPESVRFPFRRDRSVGGGPLRCGGREYARGLGVHARTVLRYPLGGEYARFRTSFGVDEEVRSFPHSGAVLLRLFVDGRLAYESPAMRAGEDPLEVSDLDLRGAKELAIEVDFADETPIGGRADLLEPVLLRE